MDDIEEDCCFDDVDGCVNEPQEVDSCRTQPSLPGWKVHWQHLQGERNDSGVYSFPDNNSFQSLNSVSQLFGGLSVSDASAKRCINNVRTDEEKVLQPDQLSSCGAEILVKKATKQPSPQNNSITSDVCVSVNDRFDSGIISEILSSQNKVPHSSQPSEHSVLTPFILPSLDFGLSPEPPKPPYTPSEAVRICFECDEDGDTELHNSIIQGKYELAMELISLAGAFDWVNISNALFQTPLHLAVITNQPTLVKRLMVGGAQLDMRDIKGNTPLHIACSKGFIDIVNILLTPVYYKDLHVNKYEIPFQRIPQDLELKNYEGFSCLHLAALGSHISCIKLLLEKNMNINITDGKSGRTILHYAAESGDEKLIKFLLSWSSIKINEKTYAGLSAMTLAKGRGHLEVVDMLYLHGAEVSDSNDDEDDSDEEMDTMYDDFELAGEAVTFTSGH